MQVRDDEPDRQVLKGRIDVSVLNALAWTTRLAIGAVLVLAGIEKVLRPYEFLHAVYGYGILTELQGLWVAAILPWFEMAVGVALLTGMAPFPAWAVSSAMFATFAGALAWSTLRGVSGSCGCGGILPGNDEVSWFSTSRAGVLSLIALTMAVLSWRADGHLSRLERSPTSPPAHAIRGAVCLLLGLLALTGCGESGPDREVLEVAYRWSDGGGYTGDGPGSPIEITYAGETVLAKGSSGTNSLGFTFAVAWEVAETRGLFEGKYLEEIIQFQRMWFRAVPEAERRGLVAAMEMLGIGREVPIAEAQPGDFLLLGVAEDPGKSAIFLGWIEHEGELIGMRYRTSRDELGGIDDVATAFKGTGVRQGWLYPEYTLVGRLDRN